MNEVLKTNDLKIGYKGKALMPAIDIALHEGEHVALVGANGSGKTTLFKTLTGNLRPIEGNIELCGKPLSDYTPNERAKLFSLVLTEKPDDLFLKVFDIVAAGRYPHSGLMAKLKDEDYEMIKAKLQVVGVYHLIDRDFVSLSARLAKEEKKTILYSSHDLELLMKHAATMWVVAKGKPLVAGKPEALFEEGILTTYIGYHENH